MSCTVTIRYEKRLVRKALNSYMARRLGPVFFMAAAGLVVLLLVAFLGGAWNWVLTLLSFALFAALAFLLYAYIVRLRAAEGFFDLANEPAVTFHFSTDGVRTESDVGSTDLKWLVFDEILKFPDLWLLVYARSGYMTLPVGQLPPECLQFIEEQISTARKRKAGKLRLDTRR